MTDIKAPLLLSFDIEEFDLPEEYQCKVTPEEKYAVSRQGTCRILDLCNANCIKATFFVTGNFASRFPEIIKEMVLGGHEIASHGMDHSNFAVAHLAESKALLEKISGRDVVGFRMARLAPVAKNDILDAGFRYESSLNPVWLPGRYNNFRTPLRPFKEDCGLWQFPVSALPGVRFPLFWLSFKNLPLMLYTAMAKFSIRHCGMFNMYSHPWEYVSAAAAPKWNIPKYITRHAGDVQTDRLEYLINQLRPV
ncbi:MAG: polysaccharide deacetylase family protein, partial [Victivallaceae bacterium]